MAIPRPLFLLALTAVLCACDAAAPRRGAAAHAPMAASSAMEFRGERPCVDCLAIQSWLRLEQAGDERSYRLIEHYRNGDREQQFDDEGEWLAEGGLLRLRSRDGGERVYAHLPDGSLQARDARGQALPAAADDVMVPVTFDSMR